MACSVEIIDRIDQPDAEDGLDLTGLADRQEGVESLERLNIPAPRRSRQALLDEPSNDSIDVLGRDLPRRSAHRSKEAIKHPGVVLHRGPGEPAHGLGDPERLHTGVLERHRVHQCVDDRRRASAAPDQTQPVNDHAHLLSGLCLKVSPYS